MEDESAQPSPESPFNLEESMRQTMDKLTQKNAELGHEMFLEIGDTDTGSRAIIFPTPVDTQEDILGISKVDARNYLVVTKDGFLAIQIPYPDTTGKLTNARLFGSLDEVRKNPGYARLIHPEAYRDKSGDGYYFDKDRNNPQLVLGRIEVDSKSFRSINDSVTGPDEETILTRNISAELVQAIIKKNKDRAQATVDEKRRKEEEKRIKRPETIARQVIQNLDNLLT